MEATLTLTSHGRPLVSATIGATAHFEFLGSLATPLSLSIFHRLSVGIVLLDRGARVVFANSAAQAMARGSGPLRLQGAVKAQCSDDDRRLSELIRTVAAGAPARAMSLSCPGERRSAMLVAMALASPTAVGALVDDDSATLLLMICNPNHATNVPIAWMMEGFGLTSAEVRVAMEMSSGNSVSEAARKLKVSSNTIKTHLSRIYEKIGINRQAELSRWMTMIGLILASTQRG
jgi:DNA-binding CsgD family transcriptional regulator